MRKIFIIAVLLSMLLFSTACAHTDRGESSGEKLNIVWQPTFEAENDLSVQPKIDGVNIVSPSWLIVMDANGFIQDTIDEEYVKNAHQKGYKVWPLITNNFDKDLTHAFLNDKNARDYIVRQMTAYAKKYKFDGYNFDFENIYEQDRDALTDFIKQASKALHKENLVISMDVTAPSDNPVWSKCYNRSELAKNVDYLILMAYDEHSRLSPQSGSVASIGWVKKGIEDTLSQGVPKNKLVLGVPLYMRLWKEKDGKVSSETLSMQGAQTLIEKHKLTPEWLNDKGQYYFEYKDKDTRCQVWQEDAASLKLKLDLVGQYGLPGAASWRKGFETPDIWPLFANKLGK